MIHIVRPSAKLMGVVIEPPLFYHKDIAKILVKQTPASMWVKLLHLMLGDQTELRADDGMLIALKRSGTTIIRCSGFKTYIEPPPNRSLGGASRQYGHVLWNALHYTASGYPDYTTKNPVQILGIDTVIKTWANHFKTNVDLSPELNSLQSVMQGLEEPIEFYGKTE